MKIVVFISLVFVTMVFPVLVLSWCAKDKKTGTKKELLKTITDAELNKKIASENFDCSECPVKSKCMGGYYTSKEDCKKNLVNYIQKGLV